MLSASAQVLRPRHPVSLGIIQEVAVCVLCLTEHTVICYVVSFFASDSRINPLSVHLHRLLLLCCSRPSPSLEPTLTMGFDLGPSWRFLCSVIHSSHGNLRDSHHVSHILSPSGAFYRSAVASPPRPSPATVPGPTCQPHWLPVPQ